jgi:hypothetical protein
MDIIWISHVNNAKYQDVLNVIIYLNAHNVKMVIIC